MSWYSMHQALRIWIELNWIKDELNWIDIWFKLHCNVDHHWQCTAMWAWVRNMLGNTLGILDHVENPLRTWCEPHCWAITQFAQLELLVLILVGKNSSRKSSKPPNSISKGEKLPWLHQEIEKITSCYSSLTMGSSLNIHKELSCHLLMAIHDEGKGLRTLRNVLQATPAVYCNTKLEENWYSSVKIDWDCWNTTLFQILPQWFKSDNILLVLQ